MFQNPLSPIINFFLLSTWSSFDQLLSDYTTYISIPPKFYLQTNSERQRGKAHCPCYFWMEYPFLEQMQARGPSNKTVLQRSHSGRPSGKGKIISYLLVQEWSRYSHCLTFSASHEISINTFHSRWIWHQVGHST